MSLVSQYDYITIFTQLLRRPVLCPWSFWYHNKWWNPSYIIDTLKSRRMQTVTATFAT